MCITQTVRSLNICAQISVHVPWSGLIFCICSSDLTVKMIRRLNLFLIRTGMVLHMSKKKRRRCSNRGMEVLPYQPNGQLCHSDVRCRIDADIVNSLKVFAVIESTTLNTT